MSTILICEVGTGHAECLPMPCRALAEAGHTVRLLVHPELLPRVGALAGVVASVEALPEAGGGWLDQIRVLRRLLAEVRRHEPACVVFNTAAGPHYRNAVLALHRRVRVVATLHDLGRLERSLRQRFVARRLAAAVVLAERLVAPARRLTGGPVIAAYPLIPVPSEAPPPKPPGEVWLACVGQIEPRRRSYGPLLAAVRAGLPPHLRVLVLGRAVGEDGHAVLRQLQEAPGITATGDFVEDAALHATLARCDGLLPLIEGHDRYQDRAVSGGVNLAYSHRLPLVAGQPFGADELDAVATLAAPGESLHGLLTRLAGDPAQVLAPARRALATDPRFQWAAPALAWRRIAGLEP